MKIIYRVYTFLREHESGCQFFDSFGLLVQFILGIIVISLLIIKRQFENPQRSWTIWFLDTFKQVLGQLTQHFINIYISVDLGEKTGHQCEWYIINGINDFSLGLLIQYLFLLIVHKIFSNTKYKFKSGEYGDKICIKGYTFQVFVWITIVTLSKLINYLLLLVFGKYLEIIGIVILTPIGENNKFKLIFVMVLFPIFVNALQFWITDNIIKGDKTIEEQIKTFQSFEDSNNNKENSIFQEIEDNLNKTIKIRS